MLQDGNSHQDPSYGWYFSNKDGKIDACDLVQQSHAGTCVNSKRLRKMAITFYPPIAKMMNVANPQPFKPSIGWL